MIRFLTDINFRGDILRGLVRREPAIDVVRAQDVGLDGVADEGVLQWAANADRVLLTHDRATVPASAARMIASGQTIAGVIVVPDDVATGPAILDLWIAWSCSEPDEWMNRIEYLPF
jgi:hypothetical protein